MGQQKYYAFREQMKQWMFDNSDIYDEFEEINSGNADDVADVETAFEKANLAEELVSPPVYPVSLLHKVCNYISIYRK